MQSFRLFLFLLIAAHASFALTIDGTVFDGKKNEVIPYANVYLLDSKMTEKCGTATDLEGRFKFVNVMKGVYNIRISSIGFSDTTFASIALSGDTVLQLNIHRFCIYDASLNDKTCPVCHKTDKVIPIKYGLLITEKGKKKKETGSSDEFYSGGCVITGCDPNWYCKRDKTKF